MEESIGYNAWCIRINCILKAQSMHKLRIKAKISLKEKLNNLSQHRDYKSTWKNIDSTLYNIYDNSYAFPIVDTIAIKNCYMLIKFANYRNKKREAVKIIQQNQKTMILANALEHLAFDLKALSDNDQIHKFGKEFNQELHKTNKQILNLLKPDAERLFQKMLMQKNCYDLLPRTYQTNRIENFSKQVEQTLSEVKS